LATLLSSASAQGHNNVLAHPETGRSFILRKLDAFVTRQAAPTADKQQLAGQEPLLEAIERLLAQHSDALADVRAEVDATAPAADSAAAAADAERKAAARAAKAQRKQADAAEKRRAKFAAAAVTRPHDSMQQQAASSAEAAASAASAAVAAASPPPELPESDIHDGTESAPFGNFHTYYDFNPIAERLRFIPPRLAADVLTRRHHQRAMAGALAMQPQHQHFAFLDVGCNEGDLTIGLMEHLIAGLNGEKNEPTVEEVDARATEAATTNAAASSSASVAAAASSSAVSPAAFVSSSSLSHVQVHAVGVDIDPVLIGRAQSKVAGALERAHARAQAQTAAGLKPPVPTLCFDTIDVMDADAIERILALLPRDCAGDDDAVSSTAAPASSAAASSAVADAVVSTAAAPSSVHPLRRRPFDLVCCYSITMWIHLHHGDAGLRSFLSRLASLTHNLIVEPQPWSCYRNARERWRRCGKQDPVHMATLAWRKDVEQRIVDFLASDEVGMRLRADLGSTKWQRRVLWFERSAEP
jgi:hypothetical protein